VVPLAFSRARQARELPRAVDAGTWRGPVDVLVGVDGSAESIDAATVVAALLGDRVGRLTVALVIDFDTALGGENGPAHRAARLELTHAADTIAASVVHDVDTALLAGKPADALVARATEGRYDVIAVGCRGRGATKLLMGSVATHLSRRGPVPVLIVSDGVTAASRR
jgi:nucleotide-binding universal stress UspA family protein